MRTSDGIPTATPSSGPGTRTKAVPTKSSLTTIWGTVRRRRVKTVVVAVIPSLIHSSSSRIEMIVLRRG